MEKQKLRFPDLKIPVCCQKMIEQIVQRGLQEEGLFRLAGLVSSINSIRSRFDNGEIVDLSTVDIHDIACLFKLFLRELPSPLIPFTLFEEQIKPFSELPLLLFLSSLLTSLSLLVCCQILIARLQASLLLARKSGSSRSSSLFQRYRACISSF